MKISYAPLRILILEERTADTELMVSALRCADFTFDWRRVDTEADYIAALDSFPAIIIADGSLSQLPAVRALQLLQEQKLDIPFFVVTGSDSEETINEWNKQGATGYLLKSQLACLEPVLHRIREERRVREETWQGDEALSFSGADFQNAFDGVEIGLAFVSQEGRWLHVNKALCEAIGYPASQLSALTIQAIVHPEDASMTLAAIDTLISGQLSSCLLETRYLHKNGSELWASTNFSVVRDAQGHPRYLMVQVQDMGARQQTKKIPHQLVSTRTGLLTHKLFLDRLQRLLSEVKRGEARQFSVLSVSLDHFQLITDSLGHAISDQVLMTLGSRLATVVGSAGAVTHLGADEFAILLEDCTASDDTIRLAERLCQEVAGPFSVNGHEAFLTISIGIAFYTNEYQQSEEVLQDAAIARHCAKAQGQAHAEIFTPAMRTRTVNRLQLETDLRRAIKRQEFRLHYQPFFSLATGQLHGFEALLRWQHPTRGLLSPGEFLSVAEETGLILPIGWWVLEEACRQIEDWRSRCVVPPAFTVNINLASSQFAHPELLPRLDRILQESSFPDFATNLQFEITEHTLIDHLTVTTDQLALLQARGVRIALDDFGTGYSSLSYLHRLPIDTLKIDRSFVSQLGGDDKSAAVISTMVTLAHTLGIDVVAEGIETTEQRAQVRELRCEYGQGYYFSKPLTAGTAETLLSARPHQVLRAAA
ncbi:MAG: EAL domain-containing protein [Candidatus Binatia bacterium]